MFLLAVRSVIRRGAAVFATALIAFAGAVLATSMAAVFATGIATGTVAADRGLLTQFAAILGGWVLCIVIFAVVTTVAVGMDTRLEEVRGLRLIGATPAQVQRMVALESATIGVSAALPALAIGYPVGGLLIVLMRRAGLVDPATSYAPGLAAPLIATALVVAACLTGGYLGSRRVAGGSPVDPAPGGRARARRGRARPLLALTVLSVGVGSSVTAFAAGPDSVLATAATGPGCVLIATGFALLATESLHLAEIWTRRLIPRSRTAGDHLARINVRTDPERIRPIAMFVTLFVGIAAGTLSMQSIENTTHRATSGTGAMIASINYVVVGFIAAFLAVALVNNMIISIGRRRAEFATMNLIGATGTQIRSMLTREVTLALIVGLIGGCVGAIVAVLPFAIVKTGNPWQSVAPVPYLIAVVPAVMTTMLVTRRLGRRQSTLALTESAGPNA
ncbi:FtsX-like permease family protein [Nocardia australiensis]|uniref:FtsX-like permease family protein n=1 Tax=Nocardia australiensis TaxID=2887191 RepID=UPI001D144DE9|nr:FtsX-like permease family protein [Nocardia australiensis]